ncbi:MAG TPA: hypothetical protein VGC21_20215 [Telluria sp.]|jgi:tetratricopeptide (TPR) repeat protein
MRIFSTVLLALAGAALLPAQAAPKTRAELGLSVKLPLPTPSAPVMAKTPRYEEVVPMVHSLNKILGSYPPKLNTKEERAKAFTLWERSLQQAWQIEKQEPNSENALFLLSELYRLGHNLDVSDTAPRATETVDRCVEKYPDSVRCHFSAAYLYLSLNPSTLPKAMKSLERLRAMSAPRVNSEVERGIFFAHLYAGDKEKASAQLDYVVSVNPTTPWVEQGRKAIREGRLEKVE